MLPDSVTWEILVVDNNSKDQTPEVVEDFSSRYLGRFRYLFEPQPGKSYALNAGIRNSQAEVLAFLDDDVTVEPTWLQNLTAPLQDRQWAGVGGRIRPEQGFSPPRWMVLEGDRSLGGALAAMFDLGDTARVNSNGLPTGPTWLFAKACLKNTGDSAPIWVLDQAVRFVAKIPSSAADY